MSNVIVYFPDKNLNAQAYLQMQVIKNINSIPSIIVQTIAVCWKMNRVLIILVFLLAPLLGMSKSDVKTSDVLKTSDVSWKTSDVLWKSSDVYSEKADGNKNLPEQKNTIRAIHNIVPTAYSGMISIHYPISYTQYQGWTKQKGEITKHNPIASRQYPIQHRHNSTLYKQYPIECPLNTIWNQQYPIQYYLNPIRYNHNPTQDEQGTIGYHHIDIRQRQSGLKLKQKAFDVAIRKQTSDVLKTSDVLLMSLDAPELRNKAKKETFFKQSINHQKKLRL